MQITTEEAKTRKRTYKVTSFACEDGDYRKQLDSVWAYFANKEEAVAEARKHVGEGGYRMIGVYACNGMNIGKQLYKWNETEGEVFYR